MYYELIYEHLKQNKGQQFTRLEIMLELSKQTELNQNRLRKALLKLYVKRDDVDRFQRSARTDGKNGWLEYVYTYTGK